MYISNITEPSWYLSSNPLRQVRVSIIYMHIYMCIYILIKELTFDFPHLEQACTSEPFSEKATAN